jgi:cytochrome P450
MTQQTSNPTLTREQPRGAMPPAAPRGGLVLGSARDLQRDTLAFIRVLAATGDVVRYRFVFWPSVFVNHPDSIKHVLQENNRNYDKDAPSNRMLKTVLGEGLLTNDGASWLHQRRLIQPAFHRQRIAGFGAQMVAATTAMLNRWDARPDTAAPLDVSAEMMGLTLRVVGQALFGAEMSGDVAAIGSSFTTVNTFLTHSFYQPFALLPGVPAHGKRGFQAARRELDRIVYRLIAERQREPADRGDLLSLLLQARDAETGEAMSSQQAHDETLTLLLAGHETTAVALSWTFALLARHPQVGERLRAEVASALAGRPPSIEDLPALPYTRMVIDEALRLYPPAWAILRRAIGDDEIGSYHIPARSNIFISPWAIHRHPAFWDDPEAFDPDRFSPARSADRPHFAYLPFGGGPRQCIGNTFALTEAQLILAAVTQRYQLRLLTDQPIEPNALITLRPRGELRMEPQRVG